MFHVKHNIHEETVSKDDLQELNKILSERDAPLSVYAEQLMWWNEKINLISRGVSRETVLEHIKHSLLLYSSIIVDESEKVIDTGTGGGLPGIPLAICLPEKRFVLNDIVSKKILATKQIIKSLGISNAITDGRSISEIAVSKEDLIVTKHAFKINELINHLNNKDWGRLIFLKGENEVKGELSGIEFPLNITITNLDKVIESEFYKGKAIVEVKKQ